MHKALSAIQGYVTTCPHGSSSKNYCARSCFLGYSVTGPGKSDSR